MLAKCLEIRWLRLLGKLERHATSPVSHVSMGISLSAWSSMQDVASACAYAVSRIAPRYMSALKRGAYCILKRGGKKLGVIGSSTLKLGKKPHSNIAKPTWQKFVNGSGLRLITGGSAILINRKNACSVMLLKKLSPRLLWQAGQSLNCVNYAESFISALSSITVMPEVYFAAGYVIAATRS